MRNAGRDIDEVPCLNPIDMFKIAPWRNSVTPSSM